MGRVRRVSVWYDVCSSGVNSSNDDSDSGGGDDRDIWILSYIV